MIEMNTLQLAFITGALCTVAGFIIAYVIFANQEIKLIKREKMIQDNIISYLTEKNKRGEK